MTPTPGGSNASSSGSIAYFDELADEYASNLPNHPGFQERFRVFDEWLAKLRPAADDASTCLDIGCGPGTLTMAAVRNGYRAVGIDGSTTMLGLAARNAAREGFSPELVRAPLPLPYETLRSLEGQANVVIASSVIEYMHDQSEFLLMCHRLLKPGGSALISFANSRSVIRAAERRLRHTRLYSGSILDVQQHQQTEHDARRLTQEAGFMVTAAQYFSMPAAVFRLWRVAYRPPWLATMFLLVAQKSL